MLKSSSKKEKRSAKEGSLVFISDAQLLFAVVFVTIILFLGKVIILGRMRGMESMPWWGELLISFAVSVAGSVGMSIFIYYKYLKKIPETTKENITGLLDARLGYEAKHHNAIIAKLDLELTTIVSKLDYELRPNNRGLSEEHTRMQAVLEKLHEKAIAEKTLRDNAGRYMDNKQSLIENAVTTLSTFSGVMQEVIVKNHELQKDVRQYEDEIKHLKSQLEQYKHHRQTPRQSRAESPDLEL